MKRFTLIEERTDFIICLGTGLTETKAKAMIFDNIYNDILVNKSGSLGEVFMTDLEANDGGCHVYYDLGGEMIHYYILEEPKNVR